MKMHVLKIMNYFLLHRSSGIQPQTWVVNSTENTMWVLFESDYSNSGRGFYIQVWSFQDELAVNDETSTNTDCGGNITVPAEGKWVSLNLQ